MLKTVLVSCAAILAGASFASANIRITEFAYAGGAGEYVELTNIGAAPIDLTGWSYDDDSRTAGTFSLSPLGIVAAGESVIFAESDAASFITNWGLVGVDVLGSNTTNLGRADEINIFDASSNLVDRLTFGDQVFAGTIRTQNVSGWTIVNGAGPYGNIDTAWVLSSVSDAQGSYTNLLGDIGSPGVYVVPEPTTLGLLAGVAMIARRRR